MIKLYNGDCMEILQSIPAGSVDMVLCDLPYGVTNLKWDSEIPLDKLWRLYTRIVKKNGAIVLFGIEPFSSYLRLSNIKQYKYDWIWEKGKAVGFLNAKHAPLRAHENLSIFINGTGRPTYNPQFIMGGKPYKKENVTDGRTGIYGEIDHRGIIKQSIDGRRYPRDVVKFKNPNNKSLHPTQKPVPLLEYFIRTYTNEGETVMDNCMGSGSTGVACINTRRNFIGVEIEKKYYDIAAERINKLQEGADGAKI